VQTECRVKLACYAEVQPVLADDLFIGKITSKTKKRADIPLSTRLHLLCPLALPSDIKHLTS
jgi:hypothetical protein